MAKKLSYVTLVVDDYDRAIDYFVDILGFSLAEDTPLSADKRWVLISASDVRETNGSSQILLAKADGSDQLDRVGDQTGGRVSFFLHTDQFDEDYALFKKRGVEFMEQPRSEPYGKVVVFKDLFGNKWDLLELKS